MKEKRTIRGSGAWWRRWLLFCRLNVCTESGASQWSWGDGATEKGRTTIQKELSVLYKSSL